MRNLSRLNSMENAVSAQRLFLFYLWYYWNNSLRLLLELDFHLNSNSRFMCCQFYLFDILKMIILNESTPFYQQ